MSHLGAGVESFDGWSVAACAVVAVVVWVVGVVERWEVDPVRGFAGAQPVGWFGWVFSQVALTQTPVLRGVGAVWDGADHPVSVPCVATRLLSLPGVVDFGFGWQAALAPAGRAVAGTVLVG